MHLRIIHTARVVAIVALALAAIAAAACGSGSSYSSSGKTPSSRSTVAAATGGGAANASASETAEAGGYGTPAASTAAGAAVLKVGETSLGKVLTDASGMTLYVFKNDTAGSGKSACNGGCAKAWPPLTASGTPAKPAALPGELGLIRRDDGTQQVTYNGLPLYHYANDKAPGDTTGQGVGNVWFVATP